MLNQSKKVLVYTVASLCLAITAGAMPDVFKFFNAHVKK
jgi:hypothetical protein